MVRSVAVPVSVADVGPLLAVPNEILAEIFLQSIPSYPSCPPLRGLDSPTNLTRICQKWRALALATPRLWRAFSLESLFLEDAQIAALETWLDRSGTWPLSIQIKIDPGDADLLDGCLEVIVLHQERWEHVDFVLTDKQMDFIKGPMPLLQSFTLRIDDTLIHYPPAECSDFPHLHTVSLCNVPILDDWLPWTQLTTVKIDCTPTGVYIFLLQEAVNLVHLYLIDWSAILIKDSDDFVVELPHLETLVVENMSGLNGPLCTGPLHLFIAPALQTLQVSCVLLGEEDPIGELDYFLSRSKCTPQKILITGKRQFSKRWFGAAFPTLPSLAFNSRYDWDQRQKGDEEDSGGSEAE